MAIQKQLDLLKKNVKEWNSWREDNPKEEIDLKSADLFQMDLSGADLHNADLRRMNLREVNLTSANLKGAQLYRANMNGVNLTNANLTEADLDRVYLGRADLRGADLSHSNLQMSLFSQTKIEGASFHKALVHGISTWNLEGIPANQSGLVITRDREPQVTVDDLKMAQFVYLLLTNKEIRNVIHTVTSKAVLILGRFYKERKDVLDALRDELKKNDLAPIIFDFEPSDNRDFTETVQLLANLSKFVIADLTDAKSIPQELSVIIPSFPSVPVIPILLKNEEEYSMFEHWERFDSVLPIFYYENQVHLLNSLKTEILESVENWKKEIDKKSKAEKKLLEQKLKFNQLKETNPDLYKQLQESGVMS
ncbi:pentapeptide repeat-containing protein [Algoriphagus sp. D3-2-R+10]|uniref:pentapeptide repeat-containing protein n=1 Tax=Algoriphagus aurantiacus TaxID=3103948 RepID=UPI002B3CC7F3|nr:pentapeptide repeat-containing protein [Algoriphagus sp. D3-2-R+10]MEB2776384.1 pentapeptide repeat-containing protein [Algoriphagus sp. D3-2-R+10]